MSVTQSTADECLLEQPSVSGTVRVWQDATDRWLSINDVEQSRIRLDSPHIIQSPVHRAFLLPLLFLDSPRRVLLAGLGGGVIVNALHAIDPSIEGDAIEIDPVVASSAQRYFALDADSWKIHISDINDWAGSGYDLIYIDIADDDSVPEWLVAESMILRLKRQLAEGGALLFNLLVEDSDRFRDILIRLRSAFDNRTVCVGFDDHWNIIVMAFSSPPAHSAEQMEARCTALSESCGCDLSELVARIRRDNPTGSGVL